MTSRSPYAHFGAVTKGDDVGELISELTDLMTIAMVHVAFKKYKKLNVQGGVTSERNEWDCRRNSPASSFVLHVSTIVLLVASQSQVSSTSHTMWKSWTHAVAVDDYHESKC